MSPSITISTNQVSNVRRELARMEHKRRWPLGLRSGDAQAIRATRIRLGAAMIEAAHAGDRTVTIELGDAAHFVEEALDRLTATANAR